MLDSRVGAYFEATLPRWETLYQERSVYATIYQQRLAAALSAVDALQLPPGSLVLDVGCGPGLGTVELARRGLQVRAVDGMAPMIEQTLARARRERVHALVRGTVADVRDLPFPRASHDLALLVGVSEWLPALERPLAEIARVLRPGGHLVLTADNSHALSCWLDPLDNPLLVPLKRALGRVVRRLAPGRQPLRTYARSSGELGVALEAAGMTVRAASTLGFGPFTLFTRPVLPEPLGHALHRRLSRLSQSRSSLLAGAGLVHVVVARRRAGDGSDGAAAGAGHRANRVADGAARAQAARGG
jgi:SAM-dependent methyltransferase